MCLLNSAFPLILYLWIRIRNPDPDPRTRISEDHTRSGSTSLLPTLSIPPGPAIIIAKLIEIKLCYHATCKAPNNRYNNMYVLQIPLFPRKGLER